MRDARSGPGRSNEKRVALVERRWSFNITPDIVFRLGEALAGIVAGTGMRVCSAKIDGLRQPVRSIDRDAVRERKNQCDSGGVEVGVRAVDDPAHVVKILIGTADVDGSGG